MSEKNKLGLFPLTMIVIGLVIGMGIFRTSKDAASAALTPSIFFSAWIIGGLVAFCGAFTYAEIGSRYPVTGGYYKVFSYSYHPSIAFALIVAYLISNAASISGVALIGAGYITKVFIWTEAAQLDKGYLSPWLAIFLFYGVNMLGLVMSARTQTVLMLIKIGMLLLVIIALFYPAIYDSKYSEVRRKTFVGKNGSCRLVFAESPCHLSYGGYQQTINFGDDVAECQQKYPRAIFIGIAVIILLYLSANIAYYRIIGFGNMKTTEEIASVVVGKMFGANRL